MKITKELIERDAEIGLCEIEKLVHSRNGKLIRLHKTKKYWHVVYLAA